MREVIEPPEEGEYRGILDGYTCPCCREGFYRTETIIIAENEIQTFYFHKDCLTDEMYDLLEALGFEIDEREGPSLDR